MTRNGTDGILFFTKSIVLIAEIPITMKKNNDRINYD